MQKQPMLGVCQFWGQICWKHKCERSNSTCIYRKTLQRNQRGTHEHTRLIILIMLHTLCLHTSYRAVNHHHLLHPLQASKSLSDFNQWEKPKILFLWPVSLLHFLLLHLYAKNEPLFFKSMTSGADVLFIVSHALRHLYSEVVSNISGAKPMKGELKCSTNTQKSLCSQRVVHTGTRRFQMKAPNLHADGGWSRHQVNWDPWAQISFIKPLRACLPPRCSLIHPHIINLWLLAFTLCFFSQKLDLH